MPHDNGMSLIDLLSKGKLRGGSDGSVKGNSASYGYIVQGSELNNHIRGKGQCPEYQNDQSSLRAELYGALAMMVVIYQLSQNLAQWNQASYIIYCDNQEVVK